MDRRITDAAIVELRGYVVRYGLLPRLGVMGHERRADLARRMAEGRRRLLFGRRTAALLDRLERGVHVKRLDAELAALRVEAGEVLP